MNQADIWELILAERKRQDEKWGEMPVGIPHDDWLLNLQEEVNEVAQALNDVTVNEQHGMPVELIHCAAVIVSWLEDRF